MARVALITATDTLPGLNSDRKLQQNRKGRQEWHIIDFFSCLRYVDVFLNNLHHYKVSFHLF